MPRRMSVSMTPQAVIERIKKATRRHVDTWKDLKAGDRLTLIEKGMGLPKGARQVILAEVKVIDVRVEPILEVTSAEIQAEGFDPLEWGELDWAAWWANGHGYRVPTWRSGSYLAWRYMARAALTGVLCRRIGWEYLDGNDDGLADRLEASRAVPLGRKIGGPLDMLALPHQVAATERHT